MDIFNTAMVFDNQYNSKYTPYYLIGTTDNMTGGPIYPSIVTNTDRIPVDTNLTFYALPKEEGEPVIGTFYIKMTHRDNLSQNFTTEFLQLTGPISFTSVPDPMSISLFLFGAILLRVFKRK